jgi:hypothetical protein
MRGAIAMSALMRRGKVAGAGQARSLVITAGRRLGRARKPTTHLLGLEADIRRGHGGEVDQVRSNIRLSAQVQSGHIGRVLADAALLSWLFERTARAVLGNNGAGCVVDARVLRASAAGIILLEREVCAHIGTHGTDAHQGLHCATSC